MPKIDWNNVDKALGPDWQHTQPEPKVESPLGELRKELTRYRLILIQVRQILAETGIHSGLVRAITKALDGVNGSVNGKGQIVNDKP